MSVLPWVVNVLLTLGILMMEENWGRVSGTSLKFKTFLKWKTGKYFLLINNP